MGEPVGPRYVTRSPYLGIPRARTQRERPVLSFMRPLDFVIIFLMLMIPPASAATNDALMAVYAVVLFLVFPIILMMRRDRLYRVCEREGHIPVRPFPDWPDRWCERCDAHLDPVDQVEASFMEQAERVRRTQAYYSDRR